VDLILMEISSRGGECSLDFAEAIKSEFPDKKLILMTELPVRAWLKRGKDLGADAFWFTEDGTEPILSVMTRVMNGEKVFPSDVPTVEIGRATNHDFSSRELEVLHELLSGDGNIEIADRMGIRPDTVNFHIKSMLSKTGFHTRTKLSVQARAKGIVV